MVTFLSLKVISIHPYFSLSPRSIEPVQCDGLDVPPHLVSSGVFGAELIILPTIRPASQPVSAKACRWLNNAAFGEKQPSVDTLTGTAGRPTVIHVRR